MSVKLTWIHHASFKITSTDAVVYIDPWKISGSPHDGHVVLISHAHYDHLSPQDVAKVARPDATIIGPADAAAKLSGAVALAPGQTHSAGAVTVRAVPAYNVGKDFHPKARGWLGLIVSVGGKSVYYAGDTDVIDEMADVGEVDLALLPVGGTYTMTAVEAAKAAKTLGAERFVPYHWGDIVGERSDAMHFTRALGERGVLLDPGGTLEL